MKDIKNEIKFNGFLKFEFFSNLFKIKEIKSSVCEIFRFSAFCSRSTKPRVNKVTGKRSLPIKLYQPHRVINKHLLLPTKTHFKNELEDVYKIFQLDFLTKHSCSKAAGQVQHDRTAGATKSSSRATESSATAAKDSSRTAQKRTEV